MGACQPLRVPDRRRIMSPFYQNPDGSIAADGSGNIMEAPTQEEFEDCCCEDSAPCECTEDFNGSEWSYLRITGYEDGQLTACSQCMESSGTPWDGIFVFTSDCLWFGNIDTSIDGKMVSDHLPIGLAIYLDAENCRWVLEVACEDDEAVNRAIWIGYKTTGSTPEGDYEWDSGCDNTPETLHVHRHDAGLYCEGCS